MGKLTIEVPDAVQSRLEKISRETGRPVGDLAGEMLQRALLLERLRTLRRELRPYAENAGFHGDEDIFRTIS